VIVPLISNATFGHELDQESHLAESSRRVDPIPVIQSGVQRLTSSPHLQRPLRWHRSGEVPMFCGAVTNDLGAGKAVSDVVVGSRRKVYA